MLTTDCLSAPTPKIIIFSALAFLVVFSFTRRQNTPKGTRLPPGPRRWPIIGNAADMPKQQEWKTFAKWAKEYGDLVYLNVLGRPMISVSSVAVAQDLFESRSSLYSDRPDFPMMSLMGADWSFGHMHYGERWRWHRKTFRQYFSASAAIGYRDIQMKHTRIMLRKLHDSPEQFLLHLRYLPGAIIMEVVYGIKVLPINDPYIKIAEKALEAAAAAGNPGTYMVDIFPILRYVPEWFPGASFQKKARIWREAILQLPSVPFEAVKAALRNGTAAPSVTVSMIEAAYEKKDLPPNYEEEIRNNAAGAYSAGSDTGVSVLSTFLLAMLLNQDAQRKAQAELDSVVGDRLPEFADRGQLAYVNAIYKEVLRWHPVAPLGFAHAAAQDDTYGKYFIPKGSIVIGNAWTMLHDEKKFGPKTEEFRPERFFEPGVADPLNIAFGFGRRVCPGQDLATDTLYIAMATILKTFSISLAKDAGGNEIPVEADFTSGFISHPSPFVCSIKPRSAAAKSLLLECPSE